MTKNTDPQRIAKVVSWVANPRPVDAIRGLLKALTDDEVDSILQEYSGSVAYLAWLERGVRMGAIADFEPKLTRVSGKRKVQEVLDVNIAPVRITDSIHLDLHHDKKRGS